MDAYLPMLIPCNYCHADLMWCEIHRMYEHGNAAGLSCSFLEEREEVARLRKMKGQIIQPETQEALT